MSRASSELRATLEHLAGDRSVPTEDRALAADLLYVLEDMQAVRERGFGHVTVTYRERAIVDVDCNLKKRKQKPVG